MKTKTGKGESGKGGKGAVERYLPTHEVGLTWHDDQGKRCTTVAPQPFKNGKRIVYLSESSWIGTSPEAVHYYAKLRVHGTWWRTPGEKYSSSGYGGKNKPKIEGISLDAKRVLKIREFDGLGRAIGGAGDETYRFNNPKDARNAAIELFKERFAPGWVLISEELTDDDEQPIVSET